MFRIVTRLYDTDDAVRAVVAAVEQAGIDPDAIRVMARAEGIMEALSEAGLPDEEAPVYAEGVRRGGTLVCVAAQDASIDAVEAALDSRPWVAFGVRRDAYRRSGSSKAPPASEEEIAHDRSR